MKFQGCITALVTPFAPDGAVNFQKLGELLEFQIAGGADAVLVLGTTGEAATTSREADDAVCRFAVERVAGRVPVIAGSGSNSTRTMLEKSLRYQRLGADGVVYFCHWGCKQTSGGAGYAKAALERAGYPTLILDGDGCDSGNVSDGQMVTRLQAFLELLEERT